MRQPQPIKNPQDLGEIGQECIRRISVLTDPAAFILVTHIFTEHLINQILLKFCPQFDLTDHHKIDLTYSQKLAVVFSIEKLPERLFQNLKRLNKLRNDIAHSIDFDFTKMDLNYHTMMHPDFSPHWFKPSYDPAAEQHHVMNVVNVVFVNTYFALHSHCVNELGFKKIPLSAPKKLE